jgi:hypothetical protein
MKIAIDCSKCGKTNEADIAFIIKTLIDCADRDSIYGGFMCADCAETLDEH